MARRADKSKLSQQKLHEDIARVIIDSGATLNLADEQGAKLNAKLHEIRTDDSIDIVTATGEIARSSYTAKNGSMLVTMIQGVDEDLLSVGYITDFYGYSVLFTQKQVYLLSKNELENMKKSILRKAPIIGYRDEGDGSFVLDLRHSNKYLGTKYNISAEPNMNIMKNRQRKRSKARSSKILEKRGGGGDDTSFSPNYHTTYDSGTSSDSQDEVSQLDIPEIDYSSDETWSDDMSSWDNSLAENLPKSPFKTAESPIAKPADRTLGNGSTLDAEDNANMSITSHKRRGQEISPDNRAELWSHRLCGIAGTRIKSMKEKKLIKGINCNNADLERLMVSEESRLSRLQSLYKPKASKSERLIDKGDAAFDILGPFTEAFDGSRYILCLVCRNEHGPTGYYTRCISSITKVTDTLVEMIKESRIDNKECRKLKRGVFMPKFETIKSDGAFKFERFTNAMKELGIRHFVSAADVSYDNGLAESFVKQVGIGVRHVLWVARDVPIGFWPYAVEHVTYIMNRLPSAKGHISPYQNYFKKVPDLSKAVTWGATTCAMKKHEKRSKRLRRQLFDVGICLGLARLSDYKSYWIWIPKKNIVTLRSNCYFHERPSDWMGRIPRIKKGLSHNRIHDTASFNVKEFYTDVMEKVHNSARRGILRDHMDTDILGMSEIRARDEYLNLNDIPAYQDSTFTNERANDEESIIADSGGAPNQYSGDKESTQSRSEMTEEMSSRFTVTDTVRDFLAKNFEPHNPDRSKKKYPKIPKEDGQTSGKWPGTYRGLPEGWSIHGKRRVSGSWDYNYESPDGKMFRSLVKALKHIEESNDEDSFSESTSNYETQNNNDSRQSVRIIDRNDEISVRIHPDVRVNRDFSVTTEQKAQAQHRISVRWNMQNDEGEITGQQDFAGTYYVERQLRQSTKTIGLLKYDEGGEQEMIVDIENIKTQIRKARNAFIWEPTLEQWVAVYAKKLKKRRGSATVGNKPIALLKKAYGRAARCIHRLKACRRISTTKKAKKRRKKNKIDPWLDPRYEQNVTEDNLWDIPAHRIYVPRNLKEAMRCPMRKFWMDSIQKELDNFKEHEVFLPVDLSHKDYVRTIGFQWVFATPMKEDGTCKKLKSRLCALGNRQVLNRDYFEDQKSSPVMRQSTFNLVILLALIRNMELYQMDFAGAFLKSEMDINLYTDKEHFPTWKTSADKTHFKIQKATYGLVQASHLWSKKLFGDLKRIGFEQNIEDPCLFTLRDKDRKIKAILVSWVDDCIVAVDCKQTWIKIIEDIKVLYKDDKTTIFSAEPTELRFALGMEVIRGKDFIELSHTAGIEALVDRYNMHGHYASTPADHRKPLTKNAPSPDAQEGTEEWEEYQHVKDFPYRQLLGSLLFITAWTRPDARYAAIQCSKYASGWSRDHITALKRVLAYLNETKHLHFRIGPNLGEHFLVNMRADLNPGPYLEELTNAKGNEVPKSDLMIFTDADFAGDTDDRRSQGGYISFLYGSPLTFNSKKQSKVADSTAVSELYGMIEASKEGEYLLRVLKSLDIPITHIALLGDNQSALNIAKLEKFSTKTKHVAVNESKLKELCRDKTIVPYYVRSQYNIADIFTKALCKETFERLRKVLLGH